MTEFMAAFITFQVTLFVVAVAALMGKFEAAFVVKLVVALRTFVKVMAGHSCDLLSVGICKSIYST
jgi:hypothetical protein